MQAEKMDRASDVCKAHLANQDYMNIRQTRKGWCMEILGCEANTEFRYFLKDKTEVAHSVEESDCCCRIFCSAIHPFKMTVKELQSEAELLTVDRPCACAAGNCKCCCYQTASFSSGGQTLGSINETCYYCIPTFKVNDASRQPIYTIHPPTCCGGCCVNCCAEGNPCCGKGCCKYPFWVFPADQRDTDGSDANPIGKIVKIPKSMAVELFTDADAFDVHFPESATVDQKAMLVGTAIFLNAVFFESGNN